MTIPVGWVRELVRYPVKSMAGISTESAPLGWHGFVGDRRFAFRRLGDDGAFPWLSASRLPELILYRPVGCEENEEFLPTRIRTPAGTLLELRSAELVREISDRLGGGVELMRLKHGVFDDAPISVIALATIAGIERAAGIDLDRRRFRANIVLETQDLEPFLEDGWVGGTLLFGDREPRAALAVTARDLRCAMINLDPDSAVQDPRAMKTVVVLNANYAGVYGTAVRTGEIRVGDPVTLVFDERM